MIKSTIRKQYNTYLIARCHKTRILAENCSWFSPKIKKQSHQIARSYMLNDIFSKWRSALVDSKGSLQSHFIHGMEGGFSVVSSNRRTPRFAVIKSFDYIRCKIFWRPAKRARLMISALYDLQLLCQSIMRRANVPMVVKKNILRLWNSIIKEVQVSESHTKLCAYKLSQKPKEFWYKQPHFEM